MNPRSKLPLQPGMTKDKATPPWCIQAFFFFQTNHRASLQTELDGFGFEQHLSTDQSDQFAVLLAHRIDRIVTQHGGLHGIDESCFQGKPHCAPIAGAFRAEPPPRSSDGVRSESVRGRPGRALDSKASASWRRIRSGRVLAFPPLPREHAPQPWEATFRSRLERVLSRLNRCVGWP